MSLTPSPVLLTPLLLPNNVPPPLPPSPFETSIQCYLHSKMVLLRYTRTTDIQYWNVKAGKRTSCLLCSPSMFHLPTFSYVYRSNRNDFLLNYFCIAVSLLCQMTFGNGHSFSLTFAMLLVHSRRWNVIEVRVWAGEREKSVAKKRVGGVIVNAVGVTDGIGWRQEEQKKSVFLGVWKMHEHPATKKLGHRSLTRSWSYEF